MKSDEEIEACAADWLACLERPEVPPAVLVGFEAWCRADPRHLTAYLRLLESWNRLDALRTASTPVATAAMVARLPRPEPRALERPRARRRMLLPLAVAGNSPAIVLRLVRRLHGSGGQRGHARARHSPQCRGGRHGRR